MADAGPLLVFGERSLTYDFGLGHPLTPLRFGPGIDLLRAVGATPGLAPELASDDQLLTCHSREYIRTVRAFSADPDRPPAAGIGAGDNPAFAGMHEASAAVAGGSLRAMEGILRGDAAHALHPGGGLHHAMRDRASGFCIYDDPALAIARARAAGLRVLYVDLDVHHGDGVQALHLADPGVLTFSIHESGRYLFPGTGGANEVGEGAAAGTAVNVPLEPYTGGPAWLAAVRRLLPALAATFGPDVIVSQHGADAHALDPLAHLRVTTREMGEAARLVDHISHRHAGGRWLATGGGGYDIYRVVPRAWALTWLAGAHREVPDHLPVAWRKHWAGLAARAGQSPLPERFEDPADAFGRSDAYTDDATSLAAETAELVRTAVLPRWAREAEDRGWWAPLVGADATDEGRRWRTAHVPLNGPPAIVDRVDAASLAGWTLLPRVVAPLDPAVAHAILVAALREDPGVRVSAALDGDRVAALAVSARSSSDRSVRELLALGVAPAARRGGLGSRLLAAHRAALDPADGRLEAIITVGERDAVEPSPLEERRRIAAGLMARAGLSARPTPAALLRVDRGALAFASSI